ERWVGAAPESAGERYGSGLDDWTLGQSADRRRDRWQGPQAGDHFFDFPLRFARRLRKEHLVVLGGEVRRKHPESGEVHLPRPDRFDDRREAPSDARDGDPVVRGAFGEAELVEAEGEHGWVSAVQVELAFVDLAEVREKIGLDTMGLADELARRGEKIGAVQRLERELHVGHARSANKAP